MRFGLLASGSRGNATLVQARGTTVLIDCGLSLRAAETALARLGVEPDAIGAILVTHEHGDHVGGVGPLARRHGIPVWLTRGTWEAAAPVLGELPEHHILCSHRPQALGDLQIHPITVPHDAREPVQFRLDDGLHRMAVLTDAGSITAHICRSLEACDALVLECNHDTTMLAAGSYPATVKARIAGDYGHLSNAQAGELLGRIGAGGLKHLVAAHLSEANNTPALARAALAAALDCAEDWIAVADQDSGLDWRSL